MPILPYKGKWPKIADNVFIAPGAVVIGDVTIHEGASVWYNTVIRADSAAIIIGRNTNVQDNCTLHVDHDAPLTIGEECTIGHGAIVHGATVGDQVLVGMHATVLSTSVVGSRTIIGANALVGERKSIPSGVLVLGVPARVARELSQAEIDQIISSAVGYRERATEHLGSLQEQED